MTCFSVGQNDQLIFIGDKVLIFFTEEEETTEIKFSKWELDRNRLVWVKMTQTTSAP